MIVAIVVIIVAKWSHLWRVFVAVVKGGEYMVIVLVVKVAVVVFVAAVKLEVAIDGVLAAVVVVDVTIFLLELH